MTPCDSHCSRNCNNNLASNNPASQYQRQKLIQNTVRVSSSNYTMNLASLSSYNSPLPTPQIVEQSGSYYVVPKNTYWNQMSDRATPSIQKTVVASGSGYHSSSVKHSITRDRPGAMSPGGLGVDIKHNSYDRYLNKLKGKSVLRKGIIPPGYGRPIFFNRAYPIYGGKVVKTSIIDCPCVNQDQLIYNNASNAIQNDILNITYKFNIGDLVLVKKTNDKKLYKGEIVEITYNIYKVKFEDNTIQGFQYCDLLVYVDSECKITPTNMEDSLCHLLMAQVQN